MEFTLSPNLANPKVVGPLQTTENVQKGLQALGLSAEDVNTMKSFDWREHKIDGKKVTLVPPFNQKSCGSCWAISSTTALSDKFIVKKNIQGLKLDPLITIVLTPDGRSINRMCGGGNPFDAGKWFEEGGSAMAGPKCQSWDNFCQINNKCTAPLPSPNDPRIANCTLDYKAVKGSTTTLTVASQQNPQQPDVDQTVIHIKQTLLSSGPIVSCFKVFWDFAALTALPSANDKTKMYNWDETNGIYINGSYKNDIRKIFDTYGQPGNKNVIVSASGHELKIPEDPATQVMGFHAVEMVGWGRGNAGRYGDVDYWIIKNSWGSKWGENGYFKVAIRDSKNNYNANCIFDSAIWEGGIWFGGALNFDADLKTGATKGKKVGTFPSHKDDTGLHISLPSKRTLVYIGIGVGVFVALLLIYYLIKHLISNRKRLGSY